MYRIGHLHIGVNRTSVTRGDLAQPTKKGPIIRISTKRRLEIVATRNRLLRHTGQFKTKWTRLGRIPWVPIRAEASIRHGKCQSEPYF
jgi:hypothetical protein